MGSRPVLKSLKEFSEKELKEKDADEVYVQRIKMEYSMRRGKFPDTRVKKIEGSQYLICAIHKQRMRVYFFDKNAQMMGAEEYKGEKKTQIWEKIKQETKTIFHFTKKQK